MYMQTHLASTRQRSDLTDDILVQQAQIGDPERVRNPGRAVQRLALSPDLPAGAGRTPRSRCLTTRLLQLYRSLPTLERVVETLKAWLSQVARNRSIDELRRKRPLLFSEIALFPDGDEYSPLTTLLDPDLQPEEQVELRELRQRLLEAIETLPSRYREIVLLRYIDQLSFREIGQALSMP